MMEFINDITTESVLELIKENYKTDTGYELQIGSNEFAIASMVSYIFGILVNRFNEQAKQRYLSTATGEYLDAIADTFGVQRPAATHATITLAIHVSEEVTIPTNFKVSYKGVVFHPISEWVYPTEWDRQVAFVGDDSNEDPTLENNIPSGEVFDIVTPLVGVETCTSVDVSSGASVPFPYDDGGDDAFRAYISEKRSAISVGGPAVAYETRAKEADSHVYDAYCMNSNDPSYVPGTATIYVFATWDNAAQQQEVMERVTNALWDDSYRPTCDNIDIHWVYASPVTVRIIVGLPLAYASSGQAKVQRVINEYVNELNTKLGNSFSISELAKRCQTPDADGTRTEYVYCENPTDNYISVNNNAANQYTIEVASYETV